MRTTGPGQLCSTTMLVLLGLLFSIPGGAHAMWARFTDAELIARSEVIVMAELIGHTRVTLAPAQASVTLGVLQVEEVLKGDAQQTLLLLVLPSSEGPQVSTALFYHKGQRGLWFLRARAPGEVGLYLADHPQRFVSATDAADRLALLRKTLQTQTGAP